MLAIPVRQSSILFVAVLSGFLLAFPRSALAAQALGSLAGIVSSGVDGAPLKSATITVLGGDFEAVTDELGRFFFAGLPTGELTLRTELPGYASVVEQVSLRPDEGGVLLIRLAPVMAALSELLVVVGREPATHGSSDAEVVVDSNSGTAADLLAASIPGVYVSLKQGVGGHRAQNPDSRFEFAHLEQRPGHLPKWNPDHVAAGSFAGRRFVGSSHFGTHPRQ